jgi:hypothetical protein
MWHHKSVMARRLIHCNVTAHPSAAWMLQQLREAVGLEERYNLTIFAASLLGSNFEAICL